MRAFKPVWIAVATFLHLSTAFPGSLNVNPFVSEQAILETLPFRREQNFENACGKKSGGQVLICDVNSPGSGPCCSEFGWCGDGPSYCEQGCQPEFSECKTTSSHQKQKYCGPKHKNKKCEPGQCCSINGLCGHTEAFCGKHCQPAFGECPNQVSTVQHCGANEPPCPFPQCCSHEGLCGVGSKFCSVPENCLSEFGWCDSKDTSKGINFTTDPRPLIGKIPYGEIISRCEMPGVAALTFDDGPAAYTNKILDILRDHDAKATFFLSGITNGKGPIDRTPEWVNTIKRMMMEGHQIGSHSWSHLHLNNLRSVERKNEMWQNEVAISNILGRYPTYMRPPYIDCQKPSGCLKDMKDLGYHVVNWEVDSGDWKIQTSLESMKSTVTAAIESKNGSDNAFIIQHDTNDKSPDLTSFILDQIEAKGWKAVTLGDCFGEPREQWYRAPIWNAPVYTAENGCVVSDTNFCGSIVKFHNRESCQNSADECFRQLGQCWNSLGEEHNACLEYDYICKEHKKHCDHCNIYQCRIEDWTFKRW